MGQGMGETGGRRERNYGWDVKRKEGRDGGREREREEGKKEGGREGGKEGKENVFILKQNKIKTKNKQKSSWGSNLQVNNLKVLFSLIVSFKEKWELHPRILLVLSLGVLCQSAFYHCYKMAEIISL